MQKKSVAKNYFYNVAYQVLAIILPIITTPYLSRVLGAENIGIYSYTISISAYFILFGSLGIALYGQREIAFNEDNPKKYSKIFWEITILKTITMSISLLIFGLTFCRNGNYHTYYRILILEIIGNLFDISWFFQGIEDFKKIVLRNVIIKLVSVICVFTFVKTSNDLVIYFFIYVFSVLIGNLSLWVNLSKILEKVNIKELNILKHVKPTIALFVPQIAVQVYTLLDRTMVGAIIEDKSEVGFYTQGQTIIKLLLTIETSLGTVMLPRIANTYAKGDDKTILEYLSKSFGVVILLAFPLIFGVIATSKKFVPIFFGAGYERVATVMNVISPILFIIGLNDAIGMQYLLPTKKQNQFTKAVICGAISNFIMNSLLIPKFGAVGAAIGTIIAESVVAGVEMKYTWKTFDYITLFKKSLKYLFFSIIMFIACLLVKNIFANNLITLIIQVLVGVAVYGVLLLINKDELIMEILDKAKQVIKTKKQSLSK